MDAAANRKLRPICAKIVPVQISHRELVRRPGAGWLSITAARSYNERALLDALRARLGAISKYRA
jgi:hypothetical protein